LLEGDDPFGYVAQISGYAQGLGKDEAAFLAIDKSTGELALLPVDELEMIDASQRAKDVKELVQQEEPPERCYEDEPHGKSGNRTLKTGCHYCPFKFKCWADANGGEGLRAFEYSYGPKYFTQVEKVPSYRGEEKEEITEQERMKEEQVIKQ
jgi:hypothetical protein